MMSSNMQLAIAATQIGVFSLVLECFFPKAGEINQNQKFKSLLSLTTYRIRKDSNKDTNY